MIEFPPSKQQKGNKHPKLDENLDIQRQLEHFEYEMNRTLIKTEQRANKKSNRFQLKIKIQYLKLMNLIQVRKSSPSSSTYFRQVSIKCLLSRIVCHSGLVSLLFSSTITYSNHTSSLTTILALKTLMVAHLFCIDKYYWV